MKRYSHVQKPGEAKQGSKAKLTDVRATFVEAQCLRVEIDKEHGDELLFATHANRWILTER